MAKLRAKYPADREKNIEQVRAAALLAGELTELVYGRRAPGFARVELCGHDTSSSQVAVLIADLGTTPPLGSQSSPGHGTDGIITSRAAASGLPHRDERLNLPAPAAHGRSGRTSKSWRCGASCSSYGTRSASPRSPRLTARFSPVYSTACRPAGCTGSCCWYAGHDLVLAPRPAQTPPSGDLCAEAAGVSARPGRSGSPWPGERGRTGRGRTSRECCASRVR